MEASSEKSNRDAFGIPRGRCELAQCRCSEFESEWPLRSGCKGCGHPLTKHMLLVENRPCYDSMDGKPCDCAGWNPAPPPLSEECVECCHRKGCHLLIMPASSGARSILGTSGSDLTKIGEQDFSPPAVLPPFLLSPTAQKRSSAAGACQMPHRRSRQHSPVSTRDDRHMPKSFDLDIYSSLPGRLKGYGRVTYHGPKCSLLKDLDSHRLVFFFNALVKYPREGRRTSLLREDRIVYFVANRTTVRANLHAYFDASRVYVLYQEEEDRVRQKWKGGDTRVGDSRRSSSSTTSSSGAENRAFSGDLRSLISQRERYNRHPSSGKHSSHDDRAESSRKRRNKEKVIPKGDLRERISNSAEVESYHMDRRPFDDKVEKVLFNRKRVDRDQIESGRLRSEKQDKIEVVVAGDKRMCVLGASPMKNDNEKMDEFMDEEEAFAQMFEFDGEESGI